jgi:uncharacterized protein (TIGR03435 family)
VKPSSWDCLVPALEFRDCGDANARRIPSWTRYGPPPTRLDSDRFEILAKADQPINSDATLMVMLQGLLAERFKLVLHRETRTLPAFVLKVTKNGPKLDPPGEAGTNTSTSNTGVIIDAHNTDMESFARILSRKMELPAVNRTGLEGIFNLKLQWTPEIARSKESAATEGPSIFAAIQEQLGLRLRSQKIPMEILMIDHAEKPSEN